MPKKIFTKILEDVEVLIDDVESALDTKVRKRIKDIKTHKIEGKSETDLDNYLKNRGVKIE